MRQFFSRFSITPICWIGIRSGRLVVLIHQSWKTQEGDAVGVARGGLGAFLKKKCFEVVRMGLAVVGYSRGGGRGACWVWVGKGELGWWEGG